MCIHQHSIYSFKLVRKKIQSNNNKNTSNKTLGERYHNLLLQEKKTKTKTNNNAHHVVTKLTGVWGKGGVSMS